MKSIISLKTALALASLLAGFQFSFAQPLAGIDQKTVRAFEEQFKEATNIKWTDRKDFAKVSFVLDNTSMIAFYSSEGDFLGVCRGITIDQLPVSERLALEHHFKGYRISELLEVGFPDMTAYYVRLENAGKSITLHSFGANGWSKFVNEKQHF